MTQSTDVYCPTCFVMPGESCVSKYLVHGDDRITPVVCATHGTRIVDSEAARWHRVNGTSKTKSLSLDPSVEIPNEIPE